MYLEFKKPFQIAFVKYAFVSCVILHHDFIQSIVKSMRGLAKFSAVVHPGFPRWGRQPMILGQKLIVWQDFCQKLHENERNWTEGEMRIPTAPTADPASWEQSTLSTVAPV